MKTKEFFEGFSCAEQTFKTGGAVQNPYPKYIYEQHTAYINKQHTDWYEGFCSNSSAYMLGISCAKNGGSIDDNPFVLNKFEPFSDEQDVISSHQFWILGFSDYFVFG